MTKNLYLAAPFFTAVQLSTVKEIETLCKSIVGLEHYSPRLDGVLQDMTPELRAKSMRDIFLLNVNKIQASDAVLSILDERDTGTTWELGYAYGIGVRVFSYTSTPAVKLNVMLGQCIEWHATGIEECKNMLTAYVADNEWRKKPDGDVF